MEYNSSYQVLPEMEIFKDTFKRDNEAPMKYLYHSDDMKDITETIAKMTLVCLLQDEATILPDDMTQTIKATMLEFATPVLKRYAAFTAWVNPNYTENDYSEIYARSYLYYFDNVPALMHEFSFDGADWKQGFEGTLFIK